MLQALEGDRVHDETDEQLMLHVRDGVKGAFERLFERYKSPIWRFFCRRVGEPGRAEELSQDVFAAVYEAAPRYQPRAPFRSYIFGIAFNVLMAYRRRRRGDAIDPVAPEGLAAPGNDPDGPLWVRQALSRLDGDDREILMLREYDQLSYQEIADVLLIPLNTVRSRLFRARTALREALLR